jgi:hypothetical protein
MTATPSPTATLPSGLEPLPSPCDRQASSPLSQPNGSSAWPAPPTEHGLFERVDELLRDAPGLLERLRAGTDLGSLAKAMILTIAVGAGAFGAAMGSFRGGRQILYAAAKLPAVMLLTLAVCAPALSALNRALDRPSDARRDLGLLLAALARASLVLAAVAPLVLLAVRLEIAYHSVVLLVVACCGAAGLVGIALFLRGLYHAAPQGIVPAALVLLGVVSLVGTQLSWTLRPYLLRPRTPEVVLIRSLEGSFVDAVARSLRSARGRYDRDFAPLPGESRPTRQRAEPTTDRGHPPIDAELEPDVEHREVWP